MVMGTHILSETALILHWTAGQAEQEIFQYFQMICGPND